MSTETAGTAKLNETGGSVTVHTFSGKGKDRATDYVIWNEKRIAGVSGHPDKYGTINEKATGEKIKAILEKKKDTTQNLTADETKIDDCFTG